MQVIPFPPPVPARIARPNIHQIVQPIIRAVERELAEYMRTPVCLPQADLQVTYSADLIIKIPPTDFKFIVFPQA